MAAVDDIRVERLKCPAWQYPDLKGHTMRVVAEELDPDDFRESAKSSKTFCVSCSCGLRGAYRGTPNAAIEWIYRAVGGETR
jgi:hypothetical protein